MRSWFITAVVSACVFLQSLPAAAQPDAQDNPLETNPLEAEPATQPELTWKDYSVKAYTIQVFGGWFGGAQYLKLPVKGNRTYLAEPDLVMGFHGDWWWDREGEGGLDYNKYDGPIKTIEDGFTVGVKLGSYLADHFHMDIMLAYSATEAVLTMVNTEDPNNLVREEIDRDPNVQVLRGALQIMYDLEGFHLAGFSPYVGLGFGGVLNRFSNLPDVGGLFLIGTFGMRRPVAGNLYAFLQADLTTFSMSRDEVHYTKSVTYKDLSAGISWYFDMVPAEIRALHEAQQRDQRRRR